MTDFMPHHLHSLYTEAAHERLLRQLAQPTPSGPGSLLGLLGVFKARFMKVCG